jgi:bacillithiol system protein YtxJ
MNWIELNSQGQVEQLVQDSHTAVQAIFKHSTRCFISKSVKRNFEAEWKGLGTDISVYHLDLIAHRDISNAIAATLGVNHESPQLIVLKDGKVIHHSSHQHISADALMA